MGAVCRELSLTGKGPDGIAERELAQAVRSYFRQNVPKGRVLVLPPDHSRLHSGAGLITNLLYELCCEAGCGVDIMPALGTHEVMGPGELRMMFGDGIPPERFLAHNWRTDVVSIGRVPADEVKKRSGGLMAKPFALQVNRRLVSGEYAAILSVGQVVPHEVVGFANYTKNILVGAGGADMINRSHFLAAIAGMENILGRVDTPVRAIFDYAEETALAPLPIHYLLTVTTNSAEGVRIHGLFAGRSRRLFEEACALSGEKNITFVEKPIRKCVVYLDPKEFHSTWIGNKATYRTRMAMADGGELVILAPGVERFGEDDGNDALIRKYGYVGRERALALLAENRDLRDCLSVAGQIIQGSSESRFRIIYCTKRLSKREVEAAGFCHMDYDAAAERYRLDRLRPGRNLLDGFEEIYYIENPALGLWSLPFQR